MLDGMNARVHAGVAAKALLVPLHLLALLIATPVLLFVSTLVLILFRPPDVALFPADRVAFVLLMFAVGLRALLYRQAPRFIFSLTVPMLALLLLVCAGNSWGSFTAESWSLIAAKFVVPFAMFHAASLIFKSEKAVQQLEVFCVLCLAYLCFVSIAFLAGANSIIFPKFIVDSAVEMHADRARGPFLQAVANGTSLNILGVLLFQLYRERRIKSFIAVPLLVALPVAVFATMTRSVWLSFVLSVGAMLWLARSGKLLRITVGLLVGAGVLLATACASSQLQTAFRDRFEDRQTVDFRLSVYQLSWDMVRERPILGWGQGEFSRQIEARISDFKSEAYAAHNTYIEILVEHGFVGLALYGWMAWSLFWVGRDSRLRFAWPTILGVYFVNSCFVVMNYQFVNALVFTWAGVLAARSRPPSAAAMDVDRLQGFRRSQD